jgi:hypothetical protein
VGVAEKVKRAPGRAKTAAPCSVQDFCGEPTLHGRRARPRHGASTRCEAERCTLLPLLRCLSLLAAALTALALLRADAELAEGSAFSSEACSALSALAAGAPAALGPRAVQLLHPPSAGASSDAILAAEALTQARARAA